MSTLVTGGTGFLGRHLVERLLLQRREVVVLGRTPAPDLVARGVTFVQASLTEADALQTACQNVETVFHVASRVGVWGPAKDFYRTNVEGTKLLLEACRRQGVRRLIYTSTPSVVYNGKNLAGANESLPLCTEAPSPYPTSKAIAERAVLAANCSQLKTVALRPHLIWGIGDPHLVPRILERARGGRLRIVGEGKNRVDLVHVENAVDAHLLAEQRLIEPPLAGGKPVDGRAFFITNGEPVVLWDWINDLLRALNHPPVTKHLSLTTATAIGTMCEAIWGVLPLRGEPPMTRFVATELAKDHWFDLTAARRDLGYAPRVSMAQGTVELVRHLQQSQPD